MRSRYASRVITRGIPLCLIALLKKRLAAATSLRSLSRKSDLSVFVDRSIEIGPAPLHLYIRLVTSPRTINRSSVTVPAFFEFRNIPLDPTENRCVRQDNSALGHHLD